jgi:hypothetical protein
LESSDGDSKGKIQSNDLGGNLFDPFDDQIVEVGRHATVASQGDRTVTYRIDWLGERLLFRPPNSGMADKALFDETEKEALLVEIAKADHNWAEIRRQRDRVGCVVQR